MANPKNRIYFFLGSGTDDYLKVTFFQNRLDRPIKRSFVAKIDQDLVQLLII